MGTRPPSSLGSPTIAGAGATVLGLAYDAAEGKLFGFRNPGDAGRLATLIDYRRLTASCHPFGSRVGPHLV
jgi:hypothetical protein